MFLEIVVEIFPTFEKTETIELANVIYFDAFTRDKFIHSILKISDTKICAIMWEFFKASHEMNQKEILDHMIGGLHSQSSSNCSMLFSLFYRSLLTYEIDIFIEKTTVIYARIYNWIFPIS